MSNEILIAPAKTRIIDNAPLIVVGLLLIDSLHFVFARLLLPHLPPLTSATFVLLVGLVEVAIFAKITGRRFHFDTLRQNMWFFLAVGFLVAVSTNLNYTAVAYIDPGTASMLAKSSVVFGLGFGLFWLRDRFNRLQSVGALLALTGVFVITFQPGDYLRLGAFMVVGSAFMYALHAALVKRYSGHLSLTDFFLFRLAATSTFLFIFAVGGGQLVWPTRQAWLLLLLVGTVDVVISRGLYYLVLRQLKLTYHAIVLTLSPVVAIGWSIFLFSTSPTLQQTIGGVAVLAGVLIVTLKPTKAAVIESPHPTGVTRG
jgi:drug/metabolite transporter (DMT)-like permease